LALKAALRSDGMRIVFDGAHFKNFIRIFSFTSLASIIGGLSASMDTIFLARFIPPAMITIFEINKRPVQLTQSLVGRHSVALMPSISHAAGKGDQAGIIALISKQFKYYSYAALLIAFLFCFTYHDLISAWMGKGKYAGDTIIYLLVANCLFGLMGYFMSNMGYALGDIKINSLVNILKGIIIGVLYYISARSYGIPGVLSVMLAGNIWIDLFFFSYRLHKLGYLDLGLVKNTTRTWAIIVPVIIIAGIGCNALLSNMIDENLHILKLIVNGGILATLFVFTVLIFDKTVRDGLAIELKAIGLKYNILKQKNMFNA